MPYIYDNISKSLNTNWNLITLITGNFILYNEFMTTNKWKSNNYLLTFKDNLKYLF